MQPVPIEIRLRACLNHAVKGLGEIDSLDAIDQFILGKCEDAYIRKSVETYFDCSIEEDSCNTILDYVVTLKNLGVE